MADFFIRYESRIVIVAESGCWLWTGASTPKGYGLFFSGTRTATGNPRPLYAHRCAYEAATGKSAAGQIIRHRCDVPSCVNPDHLVAGTQRENSKDMVMRGRSLVGSKQPNSLMSEADVQEIRRRHRGGETVASIAQDYPVHVETVRKATKQHTWRHVE